MWRWVGWVGRTALGGMPAIGGRRRRVGGCLGPNVAAEAKRRTGPTESLTWKLLSLRPGFLHRRTAVRSAGISSIPDNLEFTWGSGGRRK